MTSLLTTFLQEAQAAEFRFGDWDCAMTVARWVERVTGVDVGAEFRGTYASEEEFVAIVAREGGLVPLFGRVLANVERVSRTTDPRPGDIGVVTWEHGASGAIRVNAIGHWAVRTKTGIAHWRAPAVAAWSLPL